MINLKNSGYYPMDRFYLEMYAPSHPGVYTLSFRLDDGSYRPFFTAQSENLYRTLRAIIRRDQSITPDKIIEKLDENECYFSFLIVIEKGYRNEIEKMLTYTADPVKNIQVIAGP